MDALNFTFSAILVGFGVHLSVGDTTSIAFWLATVINAYFTFDMITNFIVFGPVYIYKERRIILYELILQLFFILLVVDEISLRRNSGEDSVTL